MANSIDDSARSRLYGLRDLREKCGELWKRKLFGARVWTETAASQRRVNSIVAYDGAEIISQSLALLAKARADKFEEPLVV